MSVLFASLHKKRLLTVLLFILLFFSIFIFIFYTTLNFMYLESVKNVTSENVKQIAENYFSSVESLRGIANQLYLENNNHQPLQENTNAAEKFFYLKKLSRYLLYNRNIETISILKDGKAYSTGSQRSALLAEYINEHYDSPQPHLYIEEQVSPTSAADNTIYNLIYYREKAADGSLQNAVMLTLNRHWADQFCNGDAQLFAFAKDGSCILNTHTTLTADNLNKSIKAFSDPLTEKFGKIKVASLRNSTFYYSFQTINNLDFVLLSKEEAFITSFNSALTATIIIVLAMCALIVAIILVSNVFHRKNMQEIRLKLARSENFFADSREQLKGDFLFRQLTEPSPEQFEEKAAELGITLPLTKPIRLILFEIDAFGQFLQLHTRAEQAEIKQQCIREIRSMLQFTPCELIQSTGKKMMFLASDKEPLNSVLLFQSIGKHLSDKLSLSVSCFVSLSGLLATEGSKLYEELLSSKKQKLLRGYGCIIFCEKLNVKKPPLSLPFFHAKEQLITDFLKNGQVDNARKILHNLLFDDLPQHDLNGALTMIKKLLFSVCLEAQKRTNDRKPSYLSTIDSLESIQEAEILFEELTKMTVSDEAFLPSGSERLIADAELYIERHYQDPMLSVSAIAESVRLSAGYLGQLYKRYRGVSINDTINNKRVEKARELFETTALPIMDVAESVGITSKTHLYNLFKKYYGTTPSNIRKNAQHS